MCNRTLVGIALLCTMLTACDHPDTPLNSARPTAVHTETFQPGRLTAQVNGAKVGRTEMRSVSYCVTRAPAAMGSVLLFSLVAENDAWSVSITSASRMPGAGTFIVADEDSNAYAATVTDKSGSNSRAKWQRYGGASGSVMFTDVTLNTIAGTFAIQAVPQWPQTNGPALDVTGNFAANRADSCATI
jgi:hypothetical protein